MIRKAVLTVHAHPVQVVQVAAYVVPQPAAAAVKHDAVLLAVVVVGLVLAPGGPNHRLAYRRERPGRQKRSASVECQTRQIYIRGTRRHADMCYRIGPLGAFTIGNVEDHTTLWLLLLAYH